MRLTDLIREITANYQKHGWTLRRVLLSGKAQQDAGDSLPKLVGASVPLEISEVNALWFARESGANHEAWELRSISANPYALFQTFSADTPKTEREIALREMEKRLKQKSSDKAN